MALRQDAGGILLGVRARLGLTRPGVPSAAGSSGARRAPCGASRPALPAFAGLGGMGLAKGVGGLRCGSGLRRDSTERVMLTGLSPRLLQPAPGERRGGVVTPPTPRGGCGALCTGIDTSAGSQRPPALRRLDRGASERPGGVPRLLADKLGVRAPPDRAERGLPPLAGGVEPPRCVEGTERWPTGLGGRLRCGEGVAGCAEPSARRGGAPTISNWGSRSSLGWFGRNGGESRGPLSVSSSCCSRCFCRAVPLSACCRC
mmetsp:Transcript_30629/g.67261  ORF Transcript_30629/g.67261 Transcript_30629/m.67261 type:complete len:259 (-) Transcript_30629:1594-2370(-)